MVGVPGRSKACATCRKRRKGCDLERPTCGQCRKADLTCEGYGTQRVFVVSTPNRRHVGYRVPVGSRPSTSSRQRTGRNHMASDVTSLLLIRPEEERRCIDLFWEAYFPSGLPIPDSAFRSYTCTWTETARKLYQDDDSLRYSLWANCLLTTGRRHGVEWMLQEGFKAYGKALASLRTSLAVAQGPRGHALIATVKLLSMFEAFSPQAEGQIADQNRNWQRHLDGELALFIARTPVAHIDGNSHHIFADERVEMALHAVLRRKQLALSVAEWKSVPWQVIPKNLKDILIDVLVDIPGLVEDFDNMQLCTDLNRKAALRLELVQECWDLDRQLQIWLGLACQNVGPTNHPGPEPTSADLVTYVAQVHGMSLFWTTSLVLYSILHTVSGPQARLPERTDPMYHARSLLDAIAILLQPRAGLYGKQSVVLPFEIAWQYTRAMSSWTHQSGVFLETLKRLRSNLSDGLTGIIKASAST